MFVHHKNRPFLLHSYDTSLIYSARQATFEMLAFWASAYLRSSGGVAMQFSPAFYSYVTCTYAISWTYAFEQARHCLFHFDLPQYKFVLCDTILIKGSNVTFFSCLKFGTNELGCISEILFIPSGWNADFTFFLRINLHGCVDVQHACIVADWYQPCWLPGAGMTKWW